MISRSRILRFVELVAPDDDGLEGQRALAEARDHRLAAGLDALGDGDFALARQKLDRAHLAQIHAHRIVGAVGRLLLGGRGGDGRAGLLGKLVGVFLGVGGASARPRPLRRLVVLDDVDAHVGEHRHGVFDLLGGHFLRGQHRVQLVHGDIAALLGGLDHLLDGIVGKVEQRAVGGAFAFGLGLFLFLCRHAFLSPSGRMSQARLGIGRQERHRVRHLRLPKPVRGALPKFRSNPVWRPAGSPSVQRNSAPSR